VPHSPTAEPATPNVRGEPVTRLAALEALRPEWEQLWLHDPRATPFQSAAWLLPWWRHLGEGTLACIALRCGASGELVGLAPLYIHADAATGRRHLFPIGIATTDYLDLLVLPGWEERVVNAMWLQLSRQGQQWDVLEFPQLRRGSPLLRDTEGRGWQCRVDAGEPHPVLALPAGTSPLRLPVPRSMAANLRTLRNRAARAGTVRFEQADARTLPDFLGALMALHASRWAQRGQGGVLAEQTVRACHAEAAPMLQDAGLLRLHTMRLNGELIAVLYCLADPPGRPEPRWYDYIGGFDPRHAVLAPGTLLIAHAIESAMAEGAVAFDFLRGAEPYKYYWGAVDQAMFTLRATWAQSPEINAPALQSGHPA
jgi:CelD/BcsL family acetyltransferase involved in cellulose biosynthesis